MRSGSHVALEPGDPPIRPLCDMIQDASKHFGRPVIVAETSGLGGRRANWLNNVVWECLAAVNRGVDLHGVCLFPAIDMPDWHGGEWGQERFCRSQRLPDGSLMRIPNIAYVEALHRWQKRLNRVTELDETTRSTAQSR